MEHYTEEQKKEISKLLSKARFNLFFITIKFSVGLLAANLAVGLLGIYLLNNLSPEDLSNFFSLSMFTNMVFMIVYLYRLLKANTEEVTTKIKEILKK